LVIPEFECRDLNSGNLGVGASCDTAVLQGLMSSEVELVPGV